MSSKTAVKTAGTYHDQPLFCFPDLCFGTPHRRKELRGGEIQERLLCGLQELHTLTVCQGSRLGLFSLWTFSFESRLTDSAQVKDGASFPYFVVFLLPLF